MTKKKLRYKGLTRFKYIIRAVKENGKLHCLETNFINRTLNMEQTTHVDILHWSVKGLSNFDSYNIAKTIRKSTHLYRIYIFDKPFTFKQMLDTIKGAKDKLKN